MTQRLNQLFSRLSLALANHLSTIDGLASFQLLTWLLVDGKSQKRRGLGVRSAVAGKSLEFPELVCRLRGRCALEAAHPCTEAPVMRVDVLSVLRYCAPVAAVGLPTRRGVSLRWTAHP